VHSSQGLEFR